MKERVALRLLGELLAWDDDQAGKEFRWLSLMSRMKYDGYRDFQAGVRFIECVIDWLQQFNADDRPVAYSLLRERLVYIGPTELQHLVELFYPEVVEPRIVRATSEKLQIPEYLVWSRPEYIKEFNSILRRSLFLGLSDGARMDSFRRSLTGTVSNEQVVVDTQFDDVKWVEMSRKLRSDTQDETAAFQFVFLVDDFVGSGKTLLRIDDSGKPSGKLEKFWPRVSTRRGEELTLDFSLIVHHYIATAQAVSTISTTHSKVVDAKGGDWYSDVEFTFGYKLPSSFAITLPADVALINLLHRYYDPEVQSSHTQVGGTDSIALGFGNCAIPLVLEHNTPNNSLPILWAESNGSCGNHAMRPLFRRRERHT